MALDSYLVSRMCNWAHWADRGMDGGIGWSKQTAFLNQVRGTGDTDYTPDLNEGALEIDVCVQALNVERPELYAVIYAHYRRNDLSVTDKISAIGCSKQTYYNKVDIAHNLILGWLNDLSCGLKIPSKEINLNKIKKYA